MVQPIKFQLSASLSIDEVKDILRAYFKEKQNIDISNISIKYNVRDSYDNESEFYEADDSSIKITLFG